MSKLSKDEENELRRKFVHLVGALEASMNHEGELCTALTQELDKADLLRSQVRAADKELERAGIEITLSVRHGGSVTGGNGSIPEGSRYDRKYLPLRSPLPTTRFASKTWIPVIVTEYSFRKN